MAPRHPLVHCALAALAGTAILISARGAVATATLPAGCTAAAGIVTCSYAATGSPQTFTVPAGVTQVTFVASGAPGAPGGFDGTPASVTPTLAPGGAGAVISSTVPVTPGAVYTLTVGGSATTDQTLCATGVTCKGGFNGGGNGGSNASGLFAGGGGGASTVADPSNAVILAAGGGGGGGAGTVSPAGATGNGAAEVDGGAGGSADTAGSPGHDGVPGPVGGGGGGAGTSSAAGAGGVQTGASGASGSGADGGAGALSAGGGGGGGYFGGGGGGAGAIDHGNNDSTSGGGGGGGGSSFATSGASPSGTNNGAGDIKVVFALPAPTLSTRASATVALGGSISDTATVTGGSAPTGQVRFDVYGPDDATCAGTVASTSTTALATDNGVVTAKSAPFTPTAAGTYRFVAHYSGDATNTAVDGACGDAGESVVVTSATPSPSPTSSTTPATTTTPTPTPTAPGSTASPTPVATSHPLAFTGASVGRIAAIGAAAVCAGICLMLVAYAHRRRRARQH